MKKSDKTAKPTHRRADPNVMGLRADVVEQNITETLETNYMPYAMSVIVSRAIPARQRRLIVRGSKRDACV